jgi:myosin heavy subunit
MGFHYNKIKNHEDHGSQWTSYSDLFMGLSVVFLLLYVTASLRSGTTGLQQQVEKERLTQRVEDLQNQLQVYNTLKKEHLQQAATPEEEKLYDGLMSRLDLLKEEAKTEKDKLRQAALENEQKEMALNQYQQLVRNMINANMIAKTRIKKRDEVIVEKNQEIRENEGQISSLNQNIKQKEQQISANEQQIAQANQELNKRISQLRYAYKSQKMTKKAFEQQMAQIQNQSQAKVRALQETNNQYAVQLNRHIASLNQLTGQLDQAGKQISQKEAQNKQLAGQLEKTKGEYEGKIGNLIGELQKTKGEYESKIGGLKAQYQAANAAQAKQLGEQINGLSGKLQSTEVALQKAIQEANARKEVAGEIKRGFAKAGIKAEVDENTGDVMIDFGDHYFDSGRADLKSGMVDVLKKAFPIYAASLMENPKLREKVENVEIIGFASPTYKGKLVDPNTLDPANRKAVDFNLDLSYARARSIFQYLFDSQKMAFKHQKDLLPLVKVSGRSFLAESKNMRNVASQPGGKFCEQYDCKKAQRVIIKFGVKQ